MEEEYITKEGEEIIKTICSYLTSALEEALEEIDEKESLNIDVDCMETAKKYICKKLNYLELEGWIDGYEDVSMEDV